MKKIFLSGFILLFCLPLLSQNDNGNAVDQSSISQGKTYAVIVGISKYENDGITQLEYSDRDAKVFSDYLRSKAGGSVPAENIRLLTNENATFAAIYDALNWLLETCKENDLVFFYFSGHGDVENTTIYKLGFLLSYNTPRMNYINNAVRLEDLNNIANTLSADRKAKVVLITDACHSGKLAGSDLRGNFLVGDQLRAVKGNEIRMTSCGPNELSNEDEGWGGGRGVFSYYLINGLTGMADKIPDGIITVDEIKNYLDSSLAKDVLLSQKKDKQTPVVNGSSNFSLAKVDSTSLALVKQKFSSPRLMVQQTFLPPLPVSPQGYLFGLIGKNNVEEIVDFDKLDKLSKEDIPFAFIKMLTDSLKKKNDLQWADSLKLKIDDEKISTLENSLKTNPDALKRFNEKLVVTLSDRGQEIINLYLDGDAAELEKRRYYNANSNGYDVYPEMFSVALKLISPEHPLYKILQIKLHYFSGVAARLKIPTADDPKPLLDLAMEEQKKAFALEENAAYIHNELGILHQFHKKYADAEKYFFRATQIAPTWAIPWSNLCGLYALTKNFDKAFNAGKIADSLQPDIQNTSVNLGFANEISGNLLFAEELYRKSIDINSRHYLPFERLGYVYMNTTQYALADSFFYEADKRKKGFHFEGNDWFSVPVVAVLPATFNEKCDVDTNILKKDDVMAFFTYGLQCYNDSNYKTAVWAFKKVIAADKTNPLVFHYMGKIFYDQKKWEDAEIMFKYAIEYYLSDSVFNLYCDSVIKKAKYPYAHDCFERVFAISHYQKNEDYYFISTVYDLWSHYEEAETYFRKCIEMNPSWLLGYIKLWQMMEKTERYTEAEKIIQDYGEYNPEISDRELNAFYRRMIQRFPDNADWYYRLGLLLYSRIDIYSGKPYLDSIVYFPLLNKEQFIDLGVYDKLNTDPALSINDKNNSGSLKIINLKEAHERAKAALVPGTNESIPMSDAIYTPRKDAIYYLSKAADLFTETKTVADINFKIGNIYVRAGSKKQAYPYYDKAVQMDPENASTRLRLIDVCTAIYKNKAALQHLNYLYDTKKINFPKHLLLAQFCIHAGQFEKAKKLLSEAEAMYPYVLPEIADLNGRLNMLSHQPAQAIVFYKKYLELDKDNCFTQYSIARLYAQLKKKDDAMEWLKVSIKNGFNYYWVLKMDATWDEYRSSQNWKELTGKIKPIDYGKNLN